MTQQTIDDDVVPVRGNDETMLRAAWEAHKTLPGFFAAWANPEPGTSRYSVKVALSDGTVREFVWVSDLVIHDGIRQGRLASEPRAIAGYRKGQIIQVRVQDIFDWMYVDNGSMKGNYTAAAMLANRSPEERAEFERANNWTPPPWTPRL